MYGRSAQHIRKKYGCLRRFKKKLNSEASFSQYLRENMDLICQIGPYQQGALTKKQVKRLQVGSPENSNPAKIPRTSEGRDKRWARRQVGELDIFGYRKRKENENKEFPKRPCRYHQLCVVFKAGRGGTCQVCCSRCSKFYSGLTEQEFKDGIKQPEPHNCKPYAARYGCNECFMEMYETQMGLDINRNKIPERMSNGYIYLCSTVRQFPSSTGERNTKTCHELWHDFKNPLPDLQCSAVGSNLCSGEQNNEVEIRHSVVLTTPQRERRTDCNEMMELEREEAESNEAKSSSDKEREKYIDDEDYYCYDSE